MVVALKNHLQALIDQALSNDYHLKSAPSHKEIVFLYDYYKNEITYWDKAEKDLIQFKTIKYRYKQLIVSTRSHTGNFRSAIVQYLQYLADLFKNHWIVLYSKDKGIYRILDYVNYGIRLNLNDSIREQLRETGMPTFVTDEIYQLLDEHNLFDPAYDDKHFVVLDDRLYQTKGLREHVLGQLDASGIEFEKLSPGSGTSFLLNTEDDFNFFNVITDAKFVKFKISIKDFRTVCLDKLFLQFNLEMIADLKSRYQHAEVEI